MLKKLSKQKISDIITYGIVLVAFIVMQILINAGQISSLFEGLMFPLCTYIILAIRKRTIEFVIVSCIHFEKNALVKAPTHIKPA